MFQGESFWYQNTSMIGNWGFLKGPFYSHEEAQDAIDDRIFPPGTQVRIVRKFETTAVLNEFTVTASKPEVASKPAE